MLTHAIPIESQFKALLPDNLNAEIVLGSVSNVKEAVAWLTYTYMAVRMRQNPLVYGITFEQLAVSVKGFARLACLCPLQRGEMHRLEQLLFGSVEAQQQVLLRLLWQAPLPGCTVLHHALVLPCTFVLLLLLLLRRCTLA